MNKKQWIKVAKELDGGTTFICNTAASLGYQAGRVAELNGIPDSYTLEAGKEPYAGSEPRVLLCLLLAAMTEKERKEIGL